VDLDEEDLHVQWGVLNFECAGAVLVLCQKNRKKLEGWRELLGHRIITVEQWGASTGGIFSLTQPRRRMRKCDTYFGQFLVGVSALASMGVSGQGEGCNVVVEAFAAEDILKNWAIC
jgi:hypothetical protein